MNKSWLCGNMCKTREIYQLNKYLSFLQITSNCSLKNMNKFIERLDCTVKHMDVKLGHSQACYMDNASCKSIFSPVPILASYSDGIDLPVQFNELPNKNLQGPVFESECELATTHLVPEPINLRSRDKIGMLRLPAGWVVCNRLQTSDEILIHVNDDIQIDKSIRFTELENVEIRMRGVRYEEEVPFKIDTVDVAQTVLKNIDEIRVCCGTQRRSKLTYSSDQLMHLLRTLEE
ncbi:uncharacterized protein LOC125500898 [Athalia rosae]|uniref:uncharacterized protein LOC125500898 n=1 Tax=Athalia rosae TaxID=37344 RepID=UPI0020349838|nr:uncharacterized protein LOC125500898 [Athalia rosae]